MADFLLSDLTDAEKGSAFLELFKLSNEVGECSTFKELAEKEQGRRLT
jgi:hypothetical protein